MSEDIRRRYYERGPEVDAIQHDGSETTAQEIVDWIYAPVEANVVPRGTFNNDVDNAYVAIGSAYGTKYVGPSDWVIRDTNRQISVMGNTEFRLKHMVVTGVV